MWAGRWAAQVLNMLALEFIVHLDNEFKASILRQKRKLIVVAMRQLNEEKPWKCVQRTASVLLRPLMYVMKFSFPAATLLALLACVVGPVCKPGAPSA